MRLHTNWGGEMKKLAIFGLAVVALSAAAVVYITCETIEGNAAVLGGGPLANGQFFEMEVVDNGLPVDGNTAGDQISPFVLLSGATSAPTTCPAPSQFNPGELDTVDAGDII